MKLINEMGQHKENHIRNNKTTIRSGWNFAQRQGEDRLRGLGVAGVNLKLFCIGLFHP